MVKNKKGISIMIGYVLLVSLAVIMGGIVYTWAKANIPQNEIGCDDGISVFIKEISCENNGTNYLMNLTLRNNGRFSFGGFLFYGSNESDINLATIDLTGNVISQTKYVLDYAWLQPGVKFPGDINSFQPGYEAFVNFSIPISTIENIQLIELTPMRWQKINNRDKVLICGNAKTRETISC